MNANQSARPSPNQIIAQKYVIVRKLGEGGMGAVYEARHNLTKKRFALKWMVPRLEADQEAMQRFVREAQATCAIEHPNVVEVYDVGSEDGAMYLVMQYLHGETLADLMSRGALSVEALLALALPLLDGLHCAHEQHVIHRDIKPENIFLANSRSRGAIPKLLDFGLSKINTPTGEEAKSGMRLTASGVMMGTPYYMAPEQVMDAATVDGRADLYSFACVMYEALAQKVPLDGNTFHALVVKITTETPEHLSTLRPDIPKPFTDVIMRGLEKLPDARYESIDAFADALSNSLAGTTQETQAMGLGATMLSGEHAAASSVGSTVPTTSGVQASTPSPPLPQAAESAIHLPTTGRGKVVFGAAALAVVSVVGALFAFGLSGGETPAPSDAAESASPAPVAAAIPEVPPVATAPGATEAVADGDPSTEAGPIPEGVAPPATEEQEAPQTDMRHAERVHRRPRRESLRRAARVAEATATPAMATPTTAASRSPSPPPADDATETMEPTRDERLGNF